MIYGKVLDGFWQGESRQKNIEYLRHVFRRAFSVLDEKLQKREQLQQCTLLDRELQILLLQNEQQINRVKHGIASAAASLKKFKKTYNFDPFTCAQVDLLEEKINDQLALADASIMFLQSSSNANDLKCSEARNNSPHITQSDTEIRKQYIGANMSHLHLTSPYISGTPAVSERHVKVNRSTSPVAAFICSS